MATLRTRRIVAASFLGMVVSLALAYLLATRTEYGKNWLLSALVSRAQGIFKGRGTLSVGVLTEIGFGHIIAEDVALLDTAGVPVIRAKHLEGTLSMSGLFGKAIHIGSLHLRDVVMDFRQDFTGPWNIAYIISGDTTRGPSKGPGFGDDIRVDKLTLTNGHVSMVGPWSPHPMFTGKARDSVIAVRDSLHDIIRTPRGLLQKREVGLERVVAHDAIVTNRLKAPASMQVDSLRGVVSDPPVKVLAAAGALRWTGDSLRFDFPTMQLPASKGSASGIVAWNQPGPLRFDVNILADAGLSDLGWIWDVLPDSGRGTARVRMRTLADANDAEYVLDSLDVRAMASHVTGRISVVSRPASLELHSVDMKFQPMTSDLLRRLSYEALPAEVRGSFAGHLVAIAGGPLTRFKVDRLDARFTDARVPGAVSSMRFSGMVAMGAEPAARDARIDDARIDLRSVRAILPDVPAVDGVLAGSLRIGSADLLSADLRTVALTWTDAEGNVSAVRGDARLRFGDRDPSMSIDVILDPLSMRALARIDTTIPLRSTLAGRLKARGTLSNLAWEASLAANSSSGIAMTGTASLVAPRWRVAGTGSVDNFDVRSWFGGETLPETALDGNVRLDVGGTRDAAGVLTIADATGFVMLRQEPATERPAFDLIASGSMDATRVLIDSATAHLGGVTFDARGALGRDSLRVDTLSVSARADSLEAVRPELRRLSAMLMPVDTAFAKSLRELAGDTLRGDFTLAGPLFGSIHDFDATLSLGARDVQVGAIRVGRVFGSARATNVLHRPFFEAAATADEISGIGAVRVSTAEFRVQQASPDSGRLVLDVTAQDTSHLVIRGGYARRDDALTVVMDSLRFQSGTATWNNEGPIRVVSDATGVRVDSLTIRSSKRGLLALSANLPLAGEVQGVVRLEQFPIGTATAFTLGTPLFAGSLTGDAKLNGTRSSPLIDWRLRADSLGMDGTYLPLITSEGTYAERRAIARAVMTDSAGGALRLEARVPVDLSLREVEKRLLSDAVDAEITADSLRLGALGFTINGVSRTRGTLAGRLALTGTFERPAATGTMLLDGLGARFDALGIEPYDGRLALRAAQDSLILERFSIRSGGPLDTIGATGAMRFALGQPATIGINVTANNAVLARQRDGTDLNLSANVNIRGPLRQATLTGNVFVPSANLFVDPLGASTALDLNQEATRELLSTEELALASLSARSFVDLGRYLTVTNTRVDFGEEVWVRTPEANVRITGGLAVTSAGQRLALEGEINANRGQYTLDLGVVRRSFTVDSGRVRFYGTPDIEPTLDISATNVVRLVTGDEVPVRVHIGGTVARPTLTLSSSAPLYSSAPESEIISLLIFGAPTFALDGNSQAQVRAVTGVLAPTAGGIAAGVLQRLFPGLNTVQVSAAGGQSQDDLSVLSVFDNLSITAGKQLGTRTFLRVNTGVCRSSAQAAKGAAAYIGVAAEYRIATGWLAQIGVDPGAAPCARLDGGLPKLQFGFDLFREWIF